MKIDIVTLFPKMFVGPFDESIINRAQEKNLVQINIHDLREWTSDERGTVDGRPYGGGVGMVMMVEPIYKALSDINKSHSAKTILLTPQGKLFNQEVAEKLSKEDHIILLSGHYEGVDERVRENLVDEEISIGDYVLTGGEIPTMVVVDAVTRLIPGVLEKKEATEVETFSKVGKKRVLEYPQYTRPSEFMGWKVPDVLLNGNHKEIEKWRKEMSLKKTKDRRPDLLKS